MTYAVSRDDVHTLADGMLRGYKNHWAGHDFLNLRRPRSSSLEDHFPGVVPLRNDTHELATRNHQQGPHGLVGHPFNGLVYGLFWVDKPDFAALVSQNRGNRATHFDFHFDLLDLTLLASQSSCPLLRRLQAAPKLVLFMRKRKKDLQDARYQRSAVFMSVSRNFSCSPRPSPSMRRPVSVKPFFDAFFLFSLFLRFPYCSRRAKPPLSPPFHPHSLLSECRSVQGGCTRPSRCCYLIIDLHSPL